MGRMVIIVGLLAIVAVVLTWFSRMNNARQSWLSNLQLPGSWEQDSIDEHDELISIDFKGELNKGTYELRCGNVTQQGNWRINQSTLVLSTSTGDESTYEIRYFEQGKIGLNGLELDHQVFHKRTNNVVPLRRF